MTPGDALKYGSYLFVALMGVVGFIRAFRKWLSVGRSVTTLQADVVTLTQANASLRAEIDQMQSRLDEKTRASYERDARIDTLSAQLRDISNAARLVENTNNNLQGRLAEQRDILGTQLTQQAAEIALLRLDVKRRDERIGELEHSQATKDANLKHANDTIARFEAELTIECQARQSLEQRVTTLEQQVRDMTAEREQLIQERDEALRQRDAAQATLADKDRLIADQATLIERQNRKIAELEANLPPVTARPEGTGGEGEPDGVAAGTQSQEKPGEVLPVTYEKLEREP